MASGSSASAYDLECLRGRHVIAVNSAWELVPFCDHLMAYDRVWWANQNPSIDAVKWTISPTASRATGAELLKPSQAHGLVDVPGRIAHGYNSGYGAVNLAYHLGAERAFLIGFDMGGDHFHGPHRRTPNPSESDFARWLDAFERMDTLGMEVINCSPGSALTRFPFAWLEDVL